MSLTVAPFAGAWIEIEIEIVPKAHFTVTPFAGAWIEIPSHGYMQFCPAMSLPSRECGLKSRLMVICSFVQPVAPHTGDRKSVV